MILQQVFQIIMLKGIIKSPLFIHILFTFA